MAYKAIKPPRTNDWRELDWWFRHIQRNLYDDLGAKEYWEYGANQWDIGVDAGELNLDIVNERNADTGVTVEGTRFENKNVVLVPTTNVPEGMVMVECSGADHRMIHNYASDGDPSKNFFIGYEAGNVTSTGYGNYAFGEYALDAITNAHSNVAIGTGAGGAITEGQTNVAIGNSVMTSMLTGQDNVAVGAFALASGTSNGDTALGKGAGSGLTTGGNNVAVGFEAAGGTATATSSSILVGREAGFNGILNQEIYIGYQAGYQAGEVGYVATRNTVVGFQAGYSMGNNPGHVVSTENVAVGNLALAGSHCSTGHNTAVGSGAGYHCAGDGNVFIGHDAGYNEAGSDKLYIDNSNTATPLIKGDFNTNELWVYGTLYANAQYILDTGGDHYMELDVGEDFTANRTLTFVLGDAARSITFEGDVTVSQDYSTDALPQFSGITIADNSATSFKIKEASIDYMCFDTTDGAEQLEFFTNQYVITKVGTNAALNAAIDTGALNILCTAGGTVGGTITVDNNSLWLSSTWGNVLDASSDQTYTAIDLNSQDYVTLYGLNIKGNPSAAGNNDLVKTTGASVYSNMLYCFLEDADYYASYWGTAANDSLHFGNVYYNAGRAGVYLSGAKRAVVAGNRTFSNNFGILSGEYSYGSAFVFNVCHQDNYGIYTYDDRSSVYMGNVLYDLAADGITASGTHINIFGNTIFEIGGLGIQMSNGNYSTVSSNNMRYPGSYGYYANNGSYQNISLNTFYLCANNRGDIWLAGSGVHNIVALNIGDPSSTSYSEYGANHVNRDYGVCIGNNFRVHGTAGIAYDADCSHNVCGWNNTSEETVAPITNAGSNNIIHEADTANMISKYNHACSWIAADGDRDGLYVGIFENLDTDNGYGVRIRAGDDANVSTLLVEDVSQTALMTIKGSGLVDLSNVLQVDTINEHTGAAGVTIDGMLIKDTNLSSVGTVACGAITSTGASQFGTLGVGGAPGVNPFKVIADAGGQYLAVFEETDNADPNGILIDYSADDPNDAGHPFWHCQDSSANRAFMYSNGGLHNYQTNDVDLSDESVKTDFDWEPEDQWAFWKSLEICKYKYADQTTDRVLWGSTAQKIQQLDSDLVGEWDEGNLGVYEQQLDWRGRKVLQEAQARIEDLEARIAVLERR